MTLAWLIFIGGILHLGILLASALTPQVLDWRTALGGLDRLTRQLVWVHGAFIALVILGLGMLSLAFAGELAAGTPLARGVCLFIALFWLARLGVQFFVFDARPHLKSLFLTAGYHALTLVFVYLAAVYSLAVLRSVT